MKIFLYFCFFLLVLNSQANCTKPRVSIITSVFKGGEFIEGFLQDIVQQTIFADCELILINANSPDNEDPIIQKYMQKYSNIIYKRLDYDPGLYAVWNIAIKMARASYITNANLDDRLKHDCYEVHARELDRFGDVDLVYSGFYKSFIPNETFDENDHTKPAAHSQYTFNKKRLITRLICYPNNHPMWRKSLHKKYGLFNEKYKTAGDIEMWIRAAGFGNAKFKKIKGFYALFYLNPHGLSTAPDSRDQIERKMIKEDLKAQFEKLLKKAQYIKKNKQWPSKNTVL